MASETGAGVSAGIGSSAVGSEHAVNKQTKASELNVNSDDRD